MSRADCKLHVWQSLILCSNNCLNFLFSEGSIISHLKLDFDADSIAPVGSNQVSVHGRIQRRVAGNPGTPWKIISCYMFP